MESLTNRTWAHARMHAPNQPPVHCMQTTKNMNIYFQMCAAMYKFIYVCICSGLLAHINLVSFQENLIVLHSWMKTLCILWIPKMKIRRFTCLPVEYRVNTETSSISFSSRLTVSIYYFTPRPAGQFFTLEPLISIPRGYWSEVKKHDCRNFKTPEPMKANMQYVMCIWSFRRWRFDME